MTQGGIFGGYGGVKTDIVSILYGVVPIEQGGLVHEGEDLLPQELLVTGIEVVLSEVAAEPAGTADPVEDHRHRHAGA
jgi:hypothetical protein